MKKIPDIIAALKSSKLLGEALGDHTTWRNWFVVLKALFALPMDAREQEVFTACTGRTLPPTELVKESYIISGRRSGKSMISGLLAVYVALFWDHSKYLSTGERGSILIISADRSQSQAVLNYCKGALKSNPVFASYIEGEQKESLQLRGNIEISVQTASYRTIRGRTVLLAILDECAFFRSESFASPDIEIVASLRPALATVPNAMLVAISSPYAKRGLLFQMYDKHYGNESDVLVWQSPTTLMNPTIDRGYIERELLKDPESAKAEWEASFREDIEGVFTLEGINACCTLPGPLSYVPGRIYTAFTDPSSGKADAWTLAISHREGARIVVDNLASWEPPFNPDVAAEEISDMLKSYRLTSVTGDRFGAAFVEQAFARNGISYQPVEAVRSALYLNLEGIINTGSIVLPKDQKMIQELVNLEKRTGRNGRPVIDHPQGGHDDRANSVAGAAYCMTTTKGGFFANCDLNPAKE